MSELDARGKHARKESNLRPAVLETAAPPWLERTKGLARMTLCASAAKALELRTESSYQRAPGLPVLAGSRRSGRCS